MLTIEELKEQVERGEIDTVVAAFTDMQGRLLGKREHAEFFLEESAEHGVEGCNYLLALDMEMDPQAGYAMASWEQGYGDFVLTPDLGTLRRILDYAGVEPNPVRDPRVRLPRAQHEVVAALFHRRPVARGSVGMT